MRHKLLGFLFGEKGEKREIDGVRYQICAEKTTVAVTRSPNATGNIVILSEVEGKNVTKIESNAFKGCKGLTSMTISESVTLIESNAFKGCAGLTSVTIPKNISVVSGAFADCASLMNISKTNE